MVVKGGRGMLVAENPAKGPSLWNGKGKEKKKRQASKEHLVWPNQVMQQLQVHTSLAALTDRAIWIVSVRLLCLLSLMKSTV